MKKIILGFENYSINENGVVTNEVTGAVKKAYVNKANQYLYVDLHKNGKSHKRPIHRLVAVAFIPNPDNKPTVDHIDGNRQNNAISNLRWATFSEQNSRFDSAGVRSEKVKVTHFKEIRKKRGGGHESWGDIDEVRYFDKISDAADHFGVTIGNISLLLKNGTIGRRGVTRGYLFEYCNGTRVTIK